MVSDNKTRRTKKEGIIVAAVSQFSVAIPGIICFTSIITELLNLHTTKEDIPPVTYVSFYREKSNSRTHTAASQDP